VADLARPFPPGRYPVVVIGSGPGGLQMSYSLRRFGIEHALLSADERPGGMFQRFPLFQRLISWTKPYAPAEPGDRRYEWFDWNSLLADDPAERAVVSEFMDGVSYFPARSEMEAAIAAFAERAGIAARYGCRWEATRREDDGFTVETTDGEYRCQVLIVAVGMTQPWKPSSPGMDLVPHYVETKPAEAYAGKSVFIIGKRNSGFEIADGLLPKARQIIIASPRPTRISVMTHSTVGARARYLQPYEDHLLGGGVFVLDAAIERVERMNGGYHVHAAGTTRPGPFLFEVDEVIAATGFGTPLLDLPDLGVRTFYQGRLPSQTPWWESASVPGIFFAGSITQGSIGLKKYGVPANSAAVHGFRYNARILARHLARTRFGVDVPRPSVRPDDLVGTLLEEAANAPELWNQQGYLARVFTFDPQAGLVDDAVEPLAHFVDASGPDAIAITVETGPEPNHERRPAVYIRRAGRAEEHILPSNQMLDFHTPDHRMEIERLVAPLLR
jgi:thioredoxin reductase